VPTAGAAQDQQNEADVEFAQGMIVHHREALRMAELATGRSQNPQVQDLAERISAAQGPEIETMSGWLEQWGEDVPAEGDVGENGFSLHIGPECVPHQLCVVSRTAHDGRYRYAFPSRVRSTSRFRWGSSSVVMTVV
jgi:hypothetical protein